MADRHDSEIATTSQPDDIIPDAIEVIGEDVSNTEILELYFQGVQSGGKREKVVEWIQYVDEGIVHVNFLSSEGKNIIYLENITYFLSSDAASCHCTRETFIYEETSLCSICSSPSS